MEGHGCIRQVYVSIEEVAMCNSSLMLDILPLFAIIRLLSDILRLRVLFSLRSQLIFLFIYCQHILIYYDTCKIITPIVLYTKSSMNI